MNELMNDLRDRGFGFIKKVRLMCCSCEITNMKLH